MGLLYDILFQEIKDFLHFGGGGIVGLENAQPTKPFHTTIQ